MTIEDEKAEFFHETYERLAPEYGYETREESAVPWDELPENHRYLMVATVKEVLDSIDSCQKYGHMWLPLHTEVTRLPLEQGEWSASPAQSLMFFFHCQRCRAVETSGWDL